MPGREVNMKILGWLRSSNKTAGQAEPIQSRAAKLASIEEIRKRSLLPGQLDPNRELYDCISHDTDSVVRIAGVKALTPTAAFAHRLCELLIREEHPDVQDAILARILTDYSARVLLDKQEAFFALEGAKSSTQRKGDKFAVRALDRKIDNICRLLMPNARIR
jgi:hypothetical protein